jgi:hypothetical protein
MKFLHFSFFWEPVLSCLTNCFVMAFGFVPNFRFSIFSGFRILSAQRGIRHFQRLHGLVGPRYRKWFAYKLRISKVQFAIVTHLFISQRFIHYLYRILGWPSNRENINGAFEIDNFNFDNSNFDNMVVHSGGLANQNIDYRPLQKWSVKIYSTGSVRWRGEPRVVPEGAILVLLEPVRARARHLLVRLHQAAQQQHGGGHPPSRLLPRRHHTLPAGAALRF